MQHVLNYMESVATYLYLFVIHKTFIVEYEPGFRSLTFVKRKDPNKSYILIY